MPAAPFRFAHSAAEHWAHAAKACTDALMPGAAADNLGFVYATDALADDFGSILAYLRQKTGIENWVGSIGIGISAGGAEYFDRPALAVMTAALPDNSFRVFPAIAKDTGELSAETRDWMRKAPAVFGLVHADPGNAAVPKLLDDLAAAGAGFLVGGFTSSRGAMYQIANRVTGGGISGALFGPQVPVATGQSQGCVPAGPFRVVSDAVENVVVALEGMKPVEALKQDMGPDTVRRLGELAGTVHVAFPVEGSDTGDYVVRTVVGVDPARGWLAVGGPVAAGDRMMFVRRDPKSAEADLIRMAAGLKRRIDGPPRGGVYVSCVARGGGLFGKEGHEVGLIRQHLGDFPLVGFYAGGEISNSRLYGYTGILILFT